MPARDCRRRSRWCRWSPGPAVISLPVCRGFVGLDDHHALAGGAAVLHAADHLLTDEAALAERHAVEQVHVGLVREGVAEADSPCRPRARRGRCGGRDSRAARGVGLAVVAACQARCDAASTACACPSSGRRGSIHIATLPAVLPARRARCPHMATTRYVGRRPRCRPWRAACTWRGAWRDRQSGLQRLQQVSVAVPCDEELEQDLALGREQRGVNGRLLRQQLHVVGNRCPATAFRHPRPRHARRRGRQAALSWHWVMAVCRSGMQRPPILLYLAPTGRRQGATSKRRTARC